MTYINLLCLSQLSLQPMKNFQYVKVAIVLCLALAGGQQSAVPQIFAHVACRHA
jgi:hypothetical protein